ncbi:hypothetical protein ABIF64_000990 [Bradyrhizobium japonicum]|uniref:Spy/CpxP family protein refolding chaperone n=1 Tax=Bradyrhizobium japonicum TaxID=375 RepID=UPI003398B523
MKSVLKLTAMLGLAVLMIPLSANAQEQKHENNKGAPAARSAPAVAPPPQRQAAPQSQAAPQREAVPQRQTAPQREAAPQRQSAPQREAAPQRQSAPQREAAPQRQAVPQREAAPQRQAAPQREAAPQGHAPQRAAAPTRQATPRIINSPRDNAPARTATPPTTHNAAPKAAISAAPTREQLRRQQREELTLRQQETRELRKLPTAQRAQKQQEINQQREQRVQQRLQPNGHAQPNALVQPNEQAQRGERRNGVARVPQAAQQGRFAARFAARAQGANFRADTAALAPRRAWSLGLRAAFVPWHGPVFWPYAYSDVFDYAFWPSGYDDGYFAYAYDDFFDGVFWGQAGLPPEYSYAYAPPNGRQARSTSSTVEEPCTQPGTGITAWPLAEINSKVGLNTEQKQLLDQVRSSGQRAASVFKASCPAKNAFAMTPPSRLQAMTLRLTATLEAVQTVRPAMEKFYSSLNDEQKERLNEIGPKQKSNAEANQTSARDGKSCSEPKAGLANLPIERIEDAVKPTNAQEGGLKLLDRATAKAVSIMQAACPEDTPITPPGRLEAMEKRLQAMIDAANTVKPALNDFYGSLSNEQKARFNRIGGKLAQSGN